MRLKAVSMFALLFSVPLLFVACGGGGGAAGLMTFAPEGDFNMIVGAAPARILASELFKEAMDKIDALKDGFEKMEETASDAGIEIKELQSVVVLSAINKNEGIVYLRGSKPIDPEDYIDYMEDTNMLTKYEEEKADGQTYWVHGQAGAVTELAGGMAVFSKEDLLEDALDAMKKGKSKLSASKEFNESLPLVDLNADAYLFIWNDIEIKASEIEPALRMIIDDEDAVEDAADAFEEIEAFGLYGYLRDGIEIHWKIRLGDEDDAKTLKDFYDEYGDDVIEKVVPQLGLFARSLNLGIEPDDIEDVFKEIEVEQRGNVLEISLRMESKDVLDLLEKLSGSEEDEAEDVPVTEEAPLAESPDYMNAERQKITVQYIQILGQSVEQYIMDHINVGAPRAEDIEELCDILVEYMIINDRRYRLDGWGNLLVYEFDESGDRRDFSITSYGSDGRPGPPVETNEYGIGVVTQYEQDIIYSRGLFTQRPE